MTSADRPREKSKADIARPLVACALLSLGVAPASSLAADGAQEPAATMTATVDALAKRLDQSTWADRERAEAELANLGADALEAIDKARADATNPEVQSRLASAAQRVRQNRQLLGTMFDVDRTFPTPADAFDALAKAMDLKLTYINDDARRKASVAKPVRLNGRSKPVLQVLDELVAATQLELRPTEGDKLTVVNFPPKPLGVPSYYAGSAVVRVILAERSRAMSFATGTSIDSLQLTLRLQAERKAKLVGEDLRVEFTVAEDERGRSLLTKENRVLSFRSADDQFQGSLRLPLLDPPAARLARLEGAMIGAGISKQARQVIEDPVPGDVVTLEYADMLVDAKLVERPDKRWQVEFEFQGESAVRMHEGRRVSNLDENAAFPQDALRVEDATGQPIELSRLEFKSVRGWPILSFLLVPEKPSAPPKRIIWNTVARTRAVTIPFRFADLALPQ